MLSLKDLNLASCTDPRKFHPSHIPITHLAHVQRVEKTSNSRTYYVYEKREN